MWRGGVVGVILAFAVVLVPGAAAKPKLYKADGNARARPEVVGAFPLALGRITRWELLRRQLVSLAG